MIDTSCQVSLTAPSARAWLIDLDQVGGPQFVVLRLVSSEARRTLIDHLVDIGAVPDEGEARVAVNAAMTSSVGVVW
jgi:hypothetical protein